MEAKINKRHIDFNRNDFSNEELITIYKALILPRLIEEKMLVLLRQGKITKWFSGWGQEGISVGCTYALASDDFILPMHRNLGVFTTRDVPFQRLFSQFQGKLNGFTTGRDRSFHFGTQDFNIVGMISHLGPQLGIADGIALSHLLKKEQKNEEKNEKKIELVNSMGLGKHKLCCRMRMITYVSLIRLLK